MAHAILIVTTSHDNMGPGKRTGVWLEEFTSPYEVFRDAGVEITVASPAGGDAPIEPRSLPAIDASAHGQAIQALLDTATLANINPADYDAVFFPGGHGPMYDLANDDICRKLIATLADSGKVVAAVCHGPAAFTDVTLGNGKSLVDGRRVTSFLDAEEEQTGLAGLMPFLLESRLRECGAQFVVAEPWAENVVTDDRLITGQNPASSRATAQAVLKALG